MTFREITYKIFKANLRRYLLYFLSSSFAMIMFFMYSSIYTNEKLMHSPQMTSGISSMLGVPTVGIIIFSIFFIVYAYNSFLKYRKKEFGLFMVLGMTDKDIRKIIFIENAIIAASSLIISLIIGTIFSKIFYLVVLRIIDIKGVPFKLSFYSYLYTAAVFIVIYIIAILCSLISTYKFQIINLIKEPRKSDKNLFRRPILGIAGVILIAVSLTYFTSCFKDGKNSIFIISIFICFFGTYLFISNTTWFLTKVFYRSKNKYNKNLLFISNLKYSLGQCNKILLLITIFISVTIFFGSFSVVLLSEAKRLAEAHNPIHVAYAEIYGKNNISDNLLNSIITTGKTPLISHKDLEFIQRSNMIFFPDEKLNKAIGSNFSVQNGKFISVLPIVKDDGEIHDNSSPENINTKLNNVDCSYVFQEQVAKVLFNKIHLFQEGNIIILNNNDYLKLKQESNPIGNGRLRLMSFKNWNDTEEIVDKLNSALENYNLSSTLMLYKDKNEDNYMFKAGSTIGEYLERIHAGAFLMFLLSFVGILFFLASCIILHFKLLTEFEREQQKYNKLNKIGITHREVSKIISKELKLLFYLPVILGSFISTFYNFALSRTIGKEAIYIKASLSIAAIYFVIQTLYYLVYKKNYVKKFCIE